MADCGLSNQSTTQSAYEEIDFGLEIRTSPLALSPSVSITPSRLFPYPPRQISSVCVPVGNSSVTARIPTRVRQNQLIKPDRATKSTTGRGLKHLSPKNRLVNNQHRNNPANRSGRVGIPSPRIKQISTGVQTKFTQTIHIKRIHQATQTEQCGKITPIHLARDIPVLKSVNQGTQTPASASKLKKFRHRIILPHRQVINVNIHVPPQL